MTTSHTDNDGRASRVHRRRARAALVATIVLVLGGGALLAACGSESADPAASSGEGPFLLPPDGADVQWAGGTYGDPTDAEPDPAQVNGYHVTWKDSSGTEISLDVALSGSTRDAPTPSTIEFEAPRDVDELRDVVELVWGPRVFAGVTFEPVDAGMLDPAMAYCYETSPSRAQPMVLGAAGRSLAVVSTMVPESCEEIERDSPVLRASRELRAVDEAEWRAFMEQWGEVGPATTTTTTASTTTTLDPGLVPYCDAVARFTSAGVMDPDSGVVGPEGIPYLEDIRDVAPSDLRPSYDAFISWVKAGSPEPAPEGVGAAGLAMTRDYIDTCQGTLE